VSPSSLPTRDERPGAEEWHRDENWYGGWLGLYHAPRDPRVWVRKRRPRFGWTLNFARRAAWLWIAALLTIPAAVLAVSAWIEVRPGGR
jgi:uncharacterized membrane protein